MVPLKCLRKVIIICICSYLVLEMHYYMIMMLYLITLTSQHVHSTVITINTTSGRNTTTCCIYGECDCSSLSTALSNMNSNTIINITSQSVDIEHHTRMGFTNLTNITIIGHSTTVKCNKSGGVYCESCENVLIKGITWDKCNNGNYHGGISFAKATNVSLINCTFQNSCTVAVGLQDVHGYVVVDHCQFLSNNIHDSFPYDKIVGGLYIGKTAHFSNFIILVVSECNFVNNGYFVTYNHPGPLKAGGLIIDDYPAVDLASWNISISNTNFASNAQVMYFHGGKSNTITLNNVSICNNHNHNSHGLYFNVSDSKGLNLFILSSYFCGNNGSVLDIVAGLSVTIVIVCLLIIKILFLQLCSLVLQRISFYAIFVLQMFELLATVWLEMRVVGFSQSIFHVQ